MKTRLFSKLLWFTCGLGLTNSAVASEAGLVGTAVVNDMRIEFYMEAPKTGMVTTSGTPVKMRTGLQTHHPEVKVFDVESGKLIPYLDLVLHFKELATGDLQMTKLPPMLGSWFHYGRNVALSHKGKYEVQVFVTAQELMRYKDMAGKWAKPAIVTFAYEWKD